MHQITQKWQKHAGSDSYFHVGGNVMKAGNYLGEEGLQPEFTEGPLCWIFMPGLKVVMAACSRRLSWPLNWEVVRMLVAFQLIAWPCSLPCLAGALLIFPVELSVCPLLYTYFHYSTTLLLQLADQLIGLFCAKCKLFYVELPIYIYGPDVPRFGNGEVGSWDMSGKFIYILCSKVRKLVKKQCSNTDLPVWAFIDSKTEIYSTNRFMYVQITLQSSGVSLKFKPRISNTYLHGKQNKVMGGVKYEMVNDVLTRSCNDGDMIIWTWSLGYIRNNCKII